MSSQTNLFEGKLYDGLSSAPIQVQVLWYPDKLIVHQAKEDGTAHTQAWPLAQIKNYQLFSKRLVSVSYGEFPSQKLEVDSEEFAALFKPPLSGVDKLTHNILHSGWMALLGVSVGVLGLLLGIYFYALPWLAEQSVAFVPQEVEVKIGEQLYQSMMQGQEVDSAKTEIANKFLKELDFQTTYPLHVTIIKSDIKNAFAMPGGHMVVYTRLLDDMKSYEELVALLGHEAGHVKHRHTTKNIFRSMSGYFVISVVLGDISGITATVLDNANNLHQLSYSRSLESEADEAGFETLIHNKVSPKGMLDLFANLQKGNEMAGQIPEFLSTHPMTENRVQHAKDLIKSHGQESIDHAFLKGFFEILQDSTTRWDTQE
jgi:beta-barrel assembly-enhancing protease